jgi:ATP/maltotriose-dependent transcriptional regulator MalT
MLFYCRRKEAGACVTDRLVGRGAESAVLDHVLEVLEGGRPAALELAGEAGIGKSRLLAELAERGDARNLLVLSGSGSEFERDLPFSVFVDALDDYLQGLDPGRFDGLEEDVRAELKHVFPSFSALATTQQVAGRHERYRSHRAVRALLGELARRLPLLLLLDDLHWADSASIELVAALLRRPPSAPVLIAFATRPRQVPGPFAAAIERAGREGGLMRVELTGLTLDETRELLAGRPGKDAAALYEQTGGNPFYLEQLARHGGDGDSTASAGEPSASGIPPAVAASLGEELALLTPTARAVLEGAAVAGDPFQLELAAAAAAVSEDAAMDGIDELIRFDLVRNTDVPRRFRFRHPLVRNVLYEGSAAGWRLGAHERCAAVLTARGAATTARAQHVERSAREGDLEAVRLLSQAGNEAARLAPASAAHWFHEALRLLPHTADATERVELLHAQAEALTATGRFADGHAALVEALELVPAGSDALFAHLSRACAAAESLLGRPHQATERLRSALSRLPAEPSVDRVALLLELAVNSLYRTRFEEMHESAQAALDDARVLGQAPFTAAALAVVGFGGSLMGDAHAADAKRAEAAALIDSLTDDELAPYLESAAWLAGAELYLDRYVEADRHASRALAVARATGQGELFLVLVQILGGVWRQRGKLTQAAELLDGGIEAARLLDNTHALVWTLSGRSTVALPLGDLQLALAAANEAFQLSRGGEATFHAAEAAAVLAAAKLETGEAEQAIELLLNHAGGEELALIAGSPRALYLELLTRCRLALDRQDDAARSADHARAWAASVRLPMAGAWSARAAAAVSLHRGDGEQAAAEALASAAAAEDAGAPVEAARSRILAGRALVLTGERDLAIAELQRAAAQLDVNQCPRYRGEADLELGRLGHRAHRRTFAGAADGTRIESLTGRELEITRLVVERLTNSQIASELFLSPKTVETHLRNIFRKVGVGSRVELARAAELAPNDRSATP